MRAQGLHGYAAVAIVWIVVGCSGSTPLGPKAPAANADVIPSGYVATPNGWYHSSCVHEVEDGAHVNRHGLVRRTDGSTLQIPACKFPALDTYSPASAPSYTSAPIDTGWIEYAFTTTSNTYSALSATWTVPAVPVRLGGLYFTFPGLVSNEFIIQPVLQFGSSAAGGGNGWAIASWHCNSGSDCIHSTLRGVNAGDQMHGTVAASACAAGSCTWTITTKDVTNGTQSVLTVDDTIGYSWATGGAVEVYRVFTCDQYPIGGVDFSSVSLTDRALGQITPSWHPVKMNPSPSCNFGVTTTATTVSLAHTQCRVSEFAAAHHPDIQECVPDVRALGNRPAPRDVDVVGPERPASRQAARDVHSPP